MKVIIAGSRSITSLVEIYKAVVLSDFEISEVVCGCADGADKLGFTLARQSAKPVHFFPAWPNQYEWASKNARPNERVEAHHGEHWRAAGHIRNAEMAKYADALILVWDRQSRGSQHMKSLAKSNGLKIYERIV